MKTLKQRVEALEKEVKKFKKVIDQTTQLRHDVYVMKKTAAGTALQAMRKRRAGGRPISGAERCACGEMTAKRAAARGHKCNQ